MDGLSQEMIIGGVIGIVGLGVLLAVCSQTECCWKGVSAEEKARRRSVRQSRMSLKSRGSKASKPPSDLESPSGSLELKSVKSTASVPKVRSARGSIASKITNLMSVEGRKSVKIAEEAAGYVTTADDVHVEVLRAPPVKVLEPEKWQIHGIYTHQLLKVGLRQLDESWNEDGLLDLDRGFAAGKGLRQESLLRAILSGGVKLQSVAANDIVAAQYDLQRLTLRQLLKIRVHHLDFTPSGAQVDSISTLQNQHEAFLNTLDGMLFKQLGKKAVGEASTVADDDSHRFGREAVQMVAAEAGLTEDLPTKRWCWCLDEDRNVYFSVDDFASTAAFPAEGVLEVDDQSKRDAIEPSGRLMWFDWRVSICRKKADLKAQPLAKVGTKGKGKDDEDEEGGSLAKAKSMTYGGGLDAKSITNLRMSLKKVSIAPLLDEDGQAASS